LQTTPRCAADIPRRASSPPTKPFDNHHTPPNSALHNSHLKADEIYELETPVGGISKIPATSGTAARGPENRPPMKMLGTPHFLHTKRLRAAAGRDRTAAISGNMVLN